jgi:hypothetical protein
MEHAHSERYLTWHLQIVSQNIGEIMDELEKIKEQIKNLGERLMSFSISDKNFNNSISINLEKMSYDLSRMCSEITQIKEYF